MTDEKARFAEALLRHDGKAFEAARDVFPNDTSAAMHAAHHWPKDPEVADETALLKKTLGDDFFLPTKADLARAVFNLAGDVRFDPRERISAYKLYAEIMGYGARADRDQTNVVNNNKVLVLPPTMSYDDWVEGTRQQQAKLIDASRA